MSRLEQKQRHSAARQRRTRKSITPSEKRPRLSLHISNQHITAQIIDDTKHTTLVYSTTVGAKDSKGTMTTKAAHLGERVATKAKAAKISRVVLDRGSKLYHGRVKAFADAARKGGLEL